MNWKLLVGTLLFTLAVGIGFEFVLIGIGSAAVVRGGAIGLALAAGFALMGRFATSRVPRGPK